jgi:hypothetical protein
VQKIVGYKWRTFLQTTKREKIMPESEMYRATDLAITDILTANAIQVLDDNELAPTAEISASHVHMNEPCCFHNCRVTTSGYITSQSAHANSAAPKKIVAKATENEHVESQRLSDSGAARLIEESKADFDNGKSIINQSLKADLLAIEEVEAYLNQKEIFLDTSQDSVHWQQDQAHDQTRFHFVISGKREGRSEWLASDARAVRTRLAALVGNLAHELKILKATVKQ